ncbi:MAG: NapC/NirT family cytochrome c, partial [Pseudomonadota bacterium]
MIKRIWQSLRMRCATCATTTLIAWGVVAGLVIAGLLMTAGAYGLAWTNTEKFCISCHEMRSTVYKEYTDTIPDKKR